MCSTYGRWAAEKNRNRIGTGVEREPVEPFSHRPSRNIPARTGGLLLRDALMPKLRAGLACFAALAISPSNPEPISWFLMMALKSRRSAWLIADDVGIGKTIEAGLIAREMLIVAKSAPHRVMPPFVRNNGSKNSTIVFTFTRLSCAPARPRV